MGRIDLTHHKCWLDALYAIWKWNDRFIHPDVVRYVQTEVKPCDIKSGESISKHLTRPSSSRNWKRPLEIPVSLTCCQGKRDLKGPGPPPQQDLGWKSSGKCHHYSCTASSDWNHFELPCKKYPNLALKRSKSDFSFPIKKELSTSFLVSAKQIITFTIGKFPSSPRKWTPVSPTCSSLGETSLSGRLENLH